MQEPKGISWVWLVLAGLLAGVLLGTVAGFLIFYKAPSEEKTCLEGSIETVFSPDAEGKVVETIRAAEKSIDVEMYLFNYRPLAEELAIAKARGVKVRVILEPRLSGAENLEMIEYLRSRDVEARWASLDYKLTHAKMMIIDGKQVLVGSTNWSNSALNKNREYSVLIEDSTVVEEFVAGFEGDWKKATQEANA